MWSKKLPIAEYSVVKKPFAGRLRVVGKISGGEYRDRTGDLLVANQALSQLS
jgi:hypothetical protein